MEFREKEIMNLTGADERWENWNQYIQGRLVPTFTRDGFTVAQMPQKTFEKLKKGVDAGLARWDELRDEGVIDVIYNSQGLLPKFIDMHQIAQEVMHEILPLHEAWAGGIKLQPTSAYGVRLYRNGSSLVMHNDKVFLVIILNLKLYVNILEVIISVHMLDTNSRYFIHYSHCPRVRRRERALAYSD